MRLGYEFNRVLDYFVIRFGSVLHRVIEVDIIELWC